MPRLPSGLLWKAKSIDPLLLHLVPVCRDLTSARNELRWLSEHVWALEGKRAYNRTLIDERVLLHQLCERRGRGEPLQYILGSEYFGDLEIQCQPGVLIPRLALPNTAVLTIVLLTTIKAGDCDFCDLFSPSLTKKGERKLHEKPRYQFQNRPITSARSLLRDGMHVFALDS